MSGHRSPDEVSGPLAVACGGVADFRFLVCTVRIIRAAFSQIPTEGSSNMSESNRALIHRWFEEVWNKGRSDAIDEMFAGRRHRARTVGRQRSAAAWT